MLSAGVAGVLHDILSSDLLTGSTRQYASELCFYLSTRLPYPQGNDLPVTGPLKSFPEVSAIDKYKDSLDNISVDSDLSSIVNEKGGRHPFVPYRVSGQNLTKLEALFTSGYGNELAASLPNPTFMSRFGFSDAMVNGDSDEDEEGGGEGDSVSSSISSGSRQSLLQYSQNSSLKSLGGGSTLPSRVSKHPLVAPPEGARGMASIQHNARQREALSCISFDLQPSVHPNSRRLQSLSAPSSHDSAGGLSLAQNRQHRDGYLTASPGTLPTNQQADWFDHQEEDEEDEEESESRLLQSAPHYRAKTAAASSSSEKYNRSSNFRIGQGYPSFDSDSIRLGRSSNNDMREESDEESVSLHSSHNFYAADTLSSRGRSDRFGRPNTTSSNSLGNVPEQSMLSFQSGESPAFPSVASSNMQFYAKIPSGGRASQTGSSIAVGSVGRLRPHTTAASTTLQHHTVNVCDLDDFMSSLDPLALNVSIGMQGRFRTGDSLVSPANSDDEQNDFFSDDEDFNPDHVDVNASTWTERSTSNPNQFDVRRRNRIRAEKLVDHKFTKSLFTKKASMRDTQNLIVRMESMLQLLDPESTGFVSWESFSRVILAVAPSHLLRADVLAFMDAQTDDTANLIDYNEFIISGKVMIIEGQQVTKNVLPISGWLTRQRSIAGDESTYTWKNHVKWYQQRKSRAVIWLIRRAARSLKQAVRLEDAAKFLHQLRHRALAVTYLLEVARMALEAQDLRIAAKRNLMMRCIHARKWVRTMDEAQKYLVACARNVLLDLEYQDNITNMKRLGRIEEMQRLEAGKKRQADYANLFKVSQMTAMSLRFLREKAAAALRYCANQDEAINFLQNYAERVQIQLLVKQEARSWLLSCADRAYHYCIRQDNVLLSLMRLGANAYKFKERQEKTLAWLNERGARAVRFVATKASITEYMNRLGSHTLRHLNDREIAYRYLTQRKKQAAALLVRQKEAIAFLQGKPQGVWSVEMSVEKAHVWLCALAKRALRLQVNQQKAFQKLQYVASRAAFMQRKQNIANTDLVQFGQQARLVHFEAITKDLPSVVTRLREERGHLEKIDARKQKSQDLTLAPQIRWKAELLEAFNWLAMLYSTPALHAPKKGLLGRVAFRRLMMNGRLLGIKPESLDEHFKSLDPATACLVPFEAVWPWFLHLAERRNKIQLGKNKNKPFLFRAIDIIGTAERAMISLMRRLNSERDQEDDLAHYDRDLYKASAKVKRGGGLMDDDSNGSQSDEDEDFAGDDEDALYGDLEYLKSGGADIGKLMRYLTRRKDAAALLVVEAAATAKLVSDLKEAVTGSGDDAAPAVDKVASRDGAIRRDEKSKSVSFSTDDKSKQVKSI